jgi:hypothetical protein
MEGIRQELAERLSVLKNRANCWKRRLEARTYYDLEMMERPATAPGWKTTRAIWPDGPAAPLACWTTSLKTSCWLLTCPTDGAQIRGMITEMCHASRRWWTSALPCHREDNSPPELR